MGFLIKCLERLKLFFCYPPSLAPRQTAQGKRAIAVMFFCSLLKFSVFFGSALFLLKLPACYRQVCPILTTGSIGLKTGQADASKNDRLNLLTLIIPLCKGDIFT